MANIFSNQTLLDASKRTVIKLTGMFDGTTGQETANVKIVGSQLRGALAVDANNAVLVSQGGVARTSYSYSVKRLIYDINIPNGYLLIQYTGSTAPGTIAVAHGEFDLNQVDNLGSILNNATVPTGNIEFTTSGAGANNSYTVMLEIIKDGKDFDFGQIERPADFNFGSYGVTP